jgi:hypothetical protein
MPIPTITPITEVPLRSGAASGAAYRATVEDFLNELTPFSSEVNASIGAMNTAVTDVDADRVAAQIASDAAVAAYAGLVAADASASSGTSASAVAIGTGTKSFTASTARLWYPGMAIILRSLAGAANYMAGRVLSYDVGTGALQVDVLVVGGAGTFADWQIYPAGPAILQSGWNLIAQTTTTGAGPWDFLNIPQSFQDLLLDVSVVHSGTSHQPQLFGSPDAGGATWSNGIGLDSTRTNATWRGAVQINRYKGDRMPLIGGVGATATASPVIISNGGVNHTLICTGGLKALRFGLTGGSLTAITALALYGRL